jgi:chromosome segregation and condensation protein ScpB
MNAKQLREALFYVENQGLTVAQLRQILFDIEDQDAELSFNWDTIAQHKANVKRQQRQPQQEV